MMQSSGISGSLTTGKRKLTPRQHQQETALLRATLLDLSTVFAIMLASALSGSLTMFTEVLRGSLLVTIEMVTLITMMRYHRGKFAEFEYGIGKIERIVTIIIASGLFFSAAYSLHAALGRLSHPEVMPTPGMIFAVAVASFNMTVNFFCAGDFVRANEEEESLILDAQLKARIVKTMASVIVVVVLVSATWLADPKAATLVDAVGATIAASYMVFIGFKLVRESLPDLMDRALPERDQLMLLKVVARYFDDFDQFDAIRSRRSGGRAYVDMDLQFDANMPLYEVNRRCRAIQEGIVELIPDAIVSIKPRVSKNWVQPAT